MRGMQMHIAQFVLLVVVVAVLAVLLGRSYSQGEGLGIGFIQFGRDLLGMGSAAVPELVRSNTELIGGHVVTSAKVLLPQGYRLFCAGNEVSVSDGEFEDGYAEIDCEMRFAPEGDLPYGTVVYDVRVVEDETGNSQLLDRFRFGFIKTDLSDLRSSSLGIDAGMLSRKVNVGDEDDSEVYRNRDLNGACEVLLNVCELSSSRNPALVSACNPMVPNPFWSYAGGQCNDGVSYAECIDDRYVPRLQNAISNCDFDGEAWYSNNYGAYVWIPGSVSGGIAEPVVINRGEFSLYNPGAELEAVMIPQASLLVDEYFAMRVPIAVPDDIDVVDPEVRYTSASASGSIPVTALVTPGNPGEQFRTIGVTIDGGRFRFSEPGEYDLTLSFTSEGTVRTWDLETLRVIEPSPYELRIFPTDESPLVARYDILPAAEPYGEPLEGDRSHILIALEAQDADMPVPVRVDFTFEGTRNQGRRVSGSVSSFEFGDGRYTAYAVVDNVFSERDVFVSRVVIETESGDVYRHSGTPFRTGQSGVLCGNPGTYGRTLCPGDLSCVLSNVREFRSGADEGPGACLSGCFESGAEVFRAAACCSNRADVLSEKTPWDDPSDDGVLRCV